MPPHLSSKLASQPPKGINMPSVCCDCFGLGMSQRQPLEPHKPPLPAGGPDKTALPPGRVADRAMGWVKECFHLWQSFPGALMRALLMAIANVAGRPGAPAPLEKGKTPSGGQEEVGRQKSKSDDGEKIRCKAGPRGHLILSSLKRWPQEDGESFTEGGHFGGGPEQFSHRAKMDKVDLEDHPARCLLHHSISSDCESALEGEGREEAPCPGSFPQNPLGSLGAGECSEESCRSHEESGDFEKDLEGDSQESVESPSASQKCMESVDRSRDSVMLGNQSVGSRPGSSEDGEYLSQYEKAKGNLGMPPLSDSFQSPLVLSLFCSPSEEEEQEEEEDSEDWLIEDEMEETHQLSLDGAVSGNRDSSSAAEENSQHQDFPENFCGSCFPRMDPSPSFCVSRSIQPTTFASPKPRRHKDITTSFHLRRPDSQWKQLCNPPKPFPPKEQSSATGQPPHQCCQMATERNRALVPTEASFGSQKESREGKKSKSHPNYLQTYCAKGDNQSQNAEVRFSPEVTVHTLVVWDYASRAARRGPWEEMARDRCRFQRRIAEVGAILKPCLEMEHRAKAWRKIYGALEGPWSAGEDP